MAMVLLQRTTAAAEVTDHVWTGCARFCFRRYGGNRGTVLAPPHACFGHSAPGSTQVI